MLGLQTTLLNTHKANSTIGGVKAKRKILAGFFECQSLET